MARHRPVARVREPVREPLVTDVARHPADLAVVGDQPVLERGDPHEPARDRAVDQRRVAAPAVRIVVAVGRAGEQRARGGQLAQDRLVRVEHVEAGELAEPVVERAVVAHRVLTGDPERGAGRLIVLAECRRQVHHAGAVLGADPVGGDDAALAGEHRQRGAIAAADQRGAAHGLARRVVHELCGVALASRRRQPGAVAVALEPGVRQLRVHRERGVGRQGPRRRRPRQHRLARRQRERHRHGGVGARAIGVVEPGLEVRQRGLAPRAIRDDLLALVHQPALVQRVEAPHHRFDVVGVHRAIGAREVDPAPEPRHHLLPLAGVARDQRAAGGVERADAVPRDVGGRGQLERAFGLELDRQPVAVPAPAPGHAVAAHRLVARHDVLDERGQDVAVVRQPGRERRAVVEHEARSTRAALDRSLERALAFPAREHGQLAIGKPDSIRDFLERHDTPLSRRGRHRTTSRPGARRDDQSRGAIERLSS